MDNFTDAQGVRHFPGEIIDLPASYKGERWLELVEPEKKVVVAASKVEPAPEALPEAKPEVPLETPKKSKKTK